MYLEFSVDWIGPGGFVFFTSFIFFALLGAAEGKLFFLNSSTAQAAQAGGFVETGYVDGYWEVEGDWEESLGSVIDQISRSCGLNGNYTMMNAETMMNAGFNQRINSGVCESAALKVDWSREQASQFDPQAPNTILNILSSVRTSALQLENNCAEINFFDTVRRKQKLWCCMDAGYR
jgi:hypothetical protein